MPKVGNQVYIMGDMKTKVMFVKSVKNQNSEGF